MGQTLGIDRDLARKIKRMSRKELDGYLTRVTDKSYNNGYEQGLVEGIALAGQAMDEILKEEVIKGTFPAETVDEIKKAVGTYIAKVPEQAAEKDFVEFLTSDEAAAIFLNYYFDTEVE